MEVTRNPWILVILVIGLVLLVWLLYSWWKNSIQKNKGQNEEKDEYSNGRRVVKEEEEDDDLNDF